MLVRIEHTFKGGVGDICDWSALYVDDQYRINRITTMAEGRFKLCRNKWHNGELKWENTFVQVYAGWQRRGVYSKLVLPHMATLLGEIHNGELDNEANHMAWAKSGAERYLIDDRFPARYRLCASRLINLA